MLPVLIICFKRPLDLREMLTSLSTSGRTVYVFIDRDDTNDSSLNDEVILTAMNFIDKLNIHIKISEINLGVGAAVPAAVTWIANTEECFIVLEDDCHLNDNGFDYFEENKNLLSDSAAILCATSPWDFLDSKIPSKSLTYSKYPLISGWATSAENWRIISKFIGSRPPYMESIVGSIKKPNNAIAISFFLAAHIRNYRGSIGAWDCAITLQMILGGRYALIPDLTMVTNTGRDSVASHTKPKIGEDQIYRIASNKSPSKTISASKKDTKQTNKEIEKRIFHMKKHHLLSFVKAILN
jgi:hypothetical protein